LSAGVLAEVPAEVVTVTFTGPGPAAAGLLTMSCVAESAVIRPDAAPKLTPVAPDKPVPVTVTSIPPAVLPPAGETPVTTGRAAGDAVDTEETYVKMPAEVTDPASVVTLMCTSPTPGGLVTLSRVAESEPSP